VIPLSLRMLLRAPNRRTQPFFAVALAVAFVTLSGCRVSGYDQESVNPHANHQKWEDPNFQIIPIQSINYTTSDIRGIFLLSPSQTDIDGAALGTGGPAMPSEARRWVMAGGGANLAWDRRWPAPKKFKIWWERVYDPALERRAGPYAKGGGLYDPYDPYVTRETRPGIAWCEYEVEFKERFMEPFGSAYPSRVRDQLVLYFFPDGTVEGHLEFPADTDVRRIDISKRDSMRVLRDKPCLKEVPNPFFGKTRPLSIQ
jgi:hypothetical protein